MNHEFYFKNFSTMSSVEQIKDFLENAPLYKTKVFEGGKHTLRHLKLNEIQGDCSICNASKPFHNSDAKNTIVELEWGKTSYACIVSFLCVTCRKDYKSFWINAIQIDEDNYQVTKIGEHPQRELPRSKALSKFFKEDKQEYNKAVICLAIGYGVAAFAYMRRVVEKNIHGLLDLIAESAEPDSKLAGSLAKLKTTSPMSDKIKIANQALPDYLKPDGFNPLGQIYELLSEGVHSLPDEECLDKAQDLQACLEFLISELATHKKNREEFKKRLSSLRKK